MGKSILFLLIVCLSATKAMTQAGVSINTAGSPSDPSAIIDVSSTTQGALIPRMTTQERNAIPNPAVGLHIFNTTTNCMNMWVGNTWKQSCFDCDFNSPTAGNNGPICQGSTLNLTATTVPGATYQWSGPNGFTSTLQNPVIVNATAGASGSYSVSATLNGCTSQLQNTVATVNSTPVTPSASNDGPVCSGSPLTLTAQTVTGASYIWSGPNGYSASVQSPVILSAQASNAGTYNVTATVNGCVSAAGSTVVTVNEIASTPGAISGASAACPNETGVVYSISAVAGALSYNWNVPSGASITSNSGTSITVSYGPSPAGSVSVSATSVCGTGGTNSLSISQSVICSPIVFSYTGGQQSFTVPAGVTSITIDAYGAQGGSNGNNSTAGRLGGRAQGTLSVTPGAVVYVEVGGSGNNGGYNGGGAGGGSWPRYGGGASDVRYGGTGLGDRVIVAGGAGSNAGYSDTYGGWNGGGGGAGGGTMGDNGITNNGAGGGGGGGTQSSGGSLGSNSGSPSQAGSSGSLGQGGKGAGETGNSGDCGNAGGGGGGYYGGGGGGYSNCGGGGGGGGSSYTGGVSGGSTTSGVRTGNGEVTISW